MSLLDIAEEFNPAGQDNPEKDKDETNPKAKPRAKPRAAQSRTRRVSALSAAQLARKRANDREAQRAIRQRTRDHIDRLELRIKELSNNIQTTRFEDLKRRNAQLEEELANLRQDIQQASLRGSSSSISSKVPYRVQYRSSSRGTNTTTYPVPEILNNTSIHPDFIPVESLKHEEEYFPDIARTVSSGSQTVPPQWILNSQVEKLDHPPGNTGQKGIPTVPVGSINYDSKHLVFPTTRSPINTAYPPYIPRFTRFRQPTFTVFETANPVEGIMTGIIRRQKQILSEGADIYTVLGPPQPDLSVIFSAKPAMAVHPVARALAQATRLATFKSNFERIALAIPHYPLMKWQIMQTPETLIDVPWFFLPTETQINVPHPLWMDFLFWPELRDAVILGQDAYDGFEFINIYCNSLNPNWPYNPRDSVYWDDEGLHPTDAVVMHCLILDNWSIDEPFQLRYPHLRPFCRFTEYG